MSDASAPLTGRRIVVGISAGIAAYKAAHVVRGLVSLGADVHVIPTPASLQFVGAATWEALSHRPILTSVFEHVDEVAHVRTGQQADAVLIVPATADLLARARMGRADDLLTATLLMARGPVLMAPAMHTEMWEHPATQENAEVLRERGIRIIEPAVGRLTGPDSGPGRLPEPPVIIDAVVAALSHAAPAADDLRGRSILITAGGTREALDPVRYLTNHSSGKQGLALAHAALMRGAQVTLVLANVMLEAPTGARVVRVTSAGELAARVRELKGEHDAVIMAAAVSDFTPAGAAEHKIKKLDGSATLTLELTQTEDILRSLVTERVKGEKPLVIAGFAAETGDDAATALQHAQRKARTKGADLLAFNDISRHTFGSDANAVIVLNSAGEELTRAAGSKADTAHAVLTALASALNSAPTTSTTPAKEHHE